jgi:hypothetical protein
MPSKTVSPVPTGALATPAQIAGAGAGPRLMLHASRRAAVAPAGVAFTAEAVGWGVENPSQDLRFDWDFGDATAEFARVPRIAAVWGTSANRAYGDRAAHVFHPSAEEFGAAAAARYTVRCTATDGARAVTATVQVEIANPDLVFAGDRTLLVASDGDFSEAPAPTFGAPFARARSFEDGTGNRRVLFKRGQRFELSRTIHFSGMGGGAAQLGAWGTGAAPVLSGMAPVKRDRLLRCVNSRAEDEMAIWGLTCESSWDAATETARNGVFPWNGLHIGGGVRGHLTLHGCRFDGCSNTIHSRSKSIRLVIADTEVTNWRDYGMLAGHQGILAVIGSRFEQRADAMGGGAVPQFIRGGANMQNDHGPLRVGSAPAGSWTLIAQSQLRSVNGWSRGNAGPDMPNGPSHQPCLRWNTGGAPDGTLRIDRVVAEGGNPAINNSTFRKKEPDKRCDIILDKLITIGTSNNGGQAWSTAFTGAVCRNFLVIVPPTAGGAWELLPPEGLMGYGGGRKSVYSDHALEGRVHVYSGTVLDWTRIGKRVLGGRLPEGAELRDLILSNVLHHAPFYPEEPQDLGAALKLAALFPPSYQGLKWQNRFKEAGPTLLNKKGEDTGRKNKLLGVPDSPEVDPSYASLAVLPDGTPTVALPFPEPGALPAAVGPDERVALDDLLGRLRGPTPHAGALEPW